MAGAILQGRYNKYPVSGDISSITDNVEGVVYEYTFPVNTGGESSGDGGGIVSNNPNNAENRYIYH
jgi:hypothetical protein